MNHNWEEKCRKLIDLMFHYGDSDPFNAPVGLFSSDFLNGSNKSLNLNTVRQLIQKSSFKDPEEFYEAVNFVFLNAKKLQKRIHSMTKALHAIFEEQFIGIAKDWKISRKYDKTDEKKLDDHNVKSKPSYNLRPNSTDKWKNQNAENEKVGISTNQTGKNKLQDSKPIKRRRKNLTRIKTISSSSSSRSHETSPSWSFNSLLAPSTSESSESESSETTIGSRYEKNLDRPSTSRDNKIERHNKRKRTPLDDDQVGRKKSKRIATRNQTKLNSKTNENSNSRQNSDHSDNSNISFSLLYKM